QGFDQWVNKVKAQGAALDRNTYLALEKPSEDEPVRYYSSVENGLYNAILNMCVAPGKMCISEMMHIDSRGGVGKESRENRQRVEYDELCRPGDEPPPAKSAPGGRSQHTEVPPADREPNARSPHVRPRTTESSPRHGD